MTSRSFLRTPSEAAGPGDEATIQDLVDTLEANRSRCVGMAANMIGVGKRIIVFVDEDLGGRITVMLNPVITASDGAFDTQEGCLSLTGERRTLRYRRIEVNYENRRFRARHATFAGWTAQIIQHEVDHCNGIIIGLSLFGVGEWGGGGGAGRVVWGYGYHVVVHRRPATA